MESPVLHIDLAVPLGWHELSDAQLRYAFELIARNYTSDEIKTLCLCRWAGLSVRHRHNADFICRLGKRTFRLSALQIAECLSALDWLDTIPPQPVCISRIGRYRPFAPTSPKWPLRNSSSATTSIKVISQPGVMICSTNSQASYISINHQL